jgi:hypothetical protein
VASGSKFVQTGGILQVVQGTKTDTFTTTSGSFTSVTGFTASITPLTTSSKILVLANFTISTDGTSGCRGFTRLSGGNAGTHIGAAAGSRLRGTGMIEYFIGANMATTICLNYLDSPNTTSSVPYGVASARGSGGTLYFNRSSSDFDSSTDGMRPASSIILMEIAG